MFFSVSSVLSVVIFFVVIRSVLKLLKGALALNAENKYLRVIRFTALKSYTPKPKSHSFFQKFRMDTHSNYTHFCPFFPKTAKKKRI